VGLFGSERGRTTRQKRPPLLFIYPKEKTLKRSAFVTSDGVGLSYLEAGAGLPLVMIPGWSQTAEQWRFQVEGLSSQYHCLALDMRGHGESDKPEHGYNIHRLSADLHEFLVHSDLRQVTLMGHSMGCSVIWGYWELFGADRLSRLILVDEPPFLTSNPAWSSDELADCGAIFTPEAVTGRCNALAGAEGDETTVGIIGGMFTKQCSQDLKQWAVACNFRMPRKHAATLLYNHCHQDWRSVISRINIPTLVVGGRVSLMPCSSLEWIARQVPGARLEIFEEAEGGHHFMFIENPQKFNSIVTEFMG
jgi:non-heme chloroperoxidase